MRRAIESLPREDYVGLGYYERWLQAMRKLVVEKGLVSEADIEGKLRSLANEAGQK